MSSRGWLLAVGIAVMVVASVWAPAQPELLTTGGACQIAPCGTLEDPERWRLAWWLWGVGLVLAAPAAAVVVRGWRAPRWPTMLLLLVVVPVLLGGVAILAMVVSLFTSVHGAATTAVVFALLPGVAVVGGWLRDRGRGGVGDQWQAVRRGSR